MTGARVTAAPVLATLGLAAFCAGQSVAVDATTAPHRFDGIWETTLSCDNANGALGFSYRFPATVRDDVLHGEKGSRGEPGFLQLDGTILPDGTATLYADGLVGAAPYAVGHRPAGTAYGYHVKAQFSDGTGSGTRIEGRPCTVEFKKT